MTDQIFVVLALLAAAMSAFICNTNSTAILMPAVPLIWPLSVAAP